MEDEQSVPAVDIGMRTHEKQQLEEMVPMAVEYMRDLGLDDEADKLDSVTLEFEPEHEAFGFTYTVGASPEDWRTLVSNLGKIRHEESLRSWWLRKKLSSRLEEAMP